jgi:hypothetical protein
MMHAEHPIDLVVAWVWGLVDKVFGSGDNTGSAKAALESPRGYEGIGERLSLELAEPFERRHTLAGGACGRYRACYNRATVNDNRAAAALALGAATILW